MTWRNKDQKRVRGKVSDGKQKDEVKGQSPKDRTSGSLPLPPTVGDWCLSLKILNSLIRRGLLILKFGKNPLNNSSCLLDCLLITKLCLLIEFLLFKGSKKKCLLWKGLKITKFWRKVFNMKYRAEKKKIERTQNYFQMIALISTT